MTSGPTIHGEIDRGNTEFYWKGTRKYQTASPSYSNDKVASVNYKNLLIHVMVSNINIIGKNG